VSDEFKAGDPVAETLPDGNFRLPGPMAVDDAEILLNTELDSEATTIGGLVTAALGRLPVPGDTATVGEYEFEVERVTDRALDSVLARRAAPEETGTRG